MSSERGFRCACFFTHNYFSRLLQRHFRYTNREAFLRDYGDRLGFCPSTNSCRVDGGQDAQRQADATFKVDDVIAEFEAERLRRESLAGEAIRRKSRILAEYTPKHARLYRFDQNFLAPEFLRLAELCRRSTDPIDALSSKDLASLGVRREKSVYAPIFSFPVFTAEFCMLVMEELNHFEGSDLPKGRPNTMNRKGVLLDELLGFERGFVDVLRSEYMQPIVDRFLPDFTDVPLDSQKAFTVSYREGEDVDLSYHYDNAEVTLNVCLGTDFSGGELYFGDVKTWNGLESDANQIRYSEVNHVIGRGILHLGAHRHGALPIEEGNRHNLILWFRSSQIRNQLCPMCGEKPKLVSVEAGGDGFTMRNS